MRGHQIVRCAELTLCAFRLNWKWNMSRSTISTFQLFERFPDAESARVYLEGRIWPAGPVCPECKSGERITARKGGFYRCNACPNDFTFTVRTGTIFERSHVPLHKWVYAMYLLVTSRKGVSSLQMAKEIGVTQKTAWFMLQRLREACGSDPLSGGGKLGGDVEVDECFIGGKDAHTNGVESVWAVLKRGLHGVYHHASRKHLHRYVDEFTFRLNAGNVARHTLDRLDSFVDGVVGRRITYEELTA